MLKKKTFKTKDEIEVTFVAPSVEAGRAALVIELNDWEPIEMKRSARGKGPFQTKLRIPKGAAVQFRYLMDGSDWCNDEAADAYWPNGLGSDNSVVLAS